MLDGLETRRALARPLRVPLWAAVIVVAYSVALAAARAEEAESPSVSLETPAATADTSAAAEQPSAVDATGERVERSATRRAGEGQPINVFWLLVQGGWFMVPILFVSLMVVTFAIERCIGLRKTRVLPPEFITELGELGAAAGGFDPRQAYRICQRYPSAAATVVSSMLLKIGRPHSEVEHTVAETSEREATRLYGNVRWINLGTSVAPLLGLLGTVWGMIVCFHDTVQLDPGQNKAEFLAKGIYIALVTTLAGLCVAIPAAIIAHYFEGRIQYLFHQIDELVFNLFPQIERFEGRVRFSRQAASGDSSPRGDAAEPPVQTRSNPS